MVNLLAGVVYLVECSDGITKIGMSRSVVEERVKACHRAARKRGAQATREWISKPVKYAREAELILIDKCVSSGGVQVIGAEWISGVNFDDVVEYALRVLDFMVGDNEPSIRNRPIALSDDDWDFFKKEMGPKWLKSEINRLRISKTSETKDQDQ